MTSFLRIYLLILLISFSFFSNNVLAVIDVSPQDTTGSIGQDLIGWINITNIPSEGIDAFGFEVVYDDNSIEYTTGVFNPNLGGTLIISDLGSGRLRIGWFTYPAYTNPNASIGVGFHINMNCQGESQISIPPSSFSADFVGATTTPATFSCFEGPLPIITEGPYAVYKSSDRALIYWKTDVPCNSQVDYGETSQYGNQVSDGNYQIIHKMLLTDLQAATLYYYKVTSKDVEGVAVIQIGLDSPFLTLATADQNPPNIDQGPLFTSLSDDSATILWWTNEYSDSKVVYWEAGVRESVSNSEFVLYHSVNLTSLNPSSTYHFYVESKDPAGNTGQSDIYSFTTLSSPDTEPPVITIPPTCDSDSVGNDFAIITWRTDEPATSEVLLQVRPSPQKSLLFKGKEEEYVINHVVTVTGLESNTWYDYIVQSEDPWGNGPTSATGIPFKTKSSSDTTAPHILAGPQVLYLCDQKALVYWETDEPSDSLVKYGAFGKSCDDFMVYDPAFDIQHYSYLSNLQPNSSYCFFITSTDYAGNSVTTGTSKTTTGFETTEDPDLTPPTFISTPYASYVSPNIAIISWQTDEVSDSVVAYAPVGLKDAGKVELIWTWDEGHDTDHSVSLGNLQGNTTYEYYVESKDPSNNSSQYPVGKAEMLTFTTPANADIEAPNLELFSITRHTQIPNAVVIEWSSDELATSFVEYGFTTQYGLTKMKGDFSTSHSVILTNLDTQKYYYRISSTDPSGNTSDYLTGSFQINDLCGFLDPTDDGSVTPEDALAALHYYLAIEDCPDPLVPCCSQADYNRDGNITPDDALCLLKVFLDLPC